MVSGGIRDGKVLRTVLLRFFLLNYKDIVSHTERRGLGRIDGVIHVTVKSKTST